jgi:hypothetical protein
MDENEKTSVLDSKGKELEGFITEELHEVFEIDTDGKRVKSVAYFRDKNLAIAYKDNQKDPMYHKVETVHAITSGTIGYKISDMFILIDEEETTKVVKQKVLAKLTREEKVLLGL